MYIGLFVYLAVGIIFLIAMVYKKIKKQDEVKRKRSIIILVSTFVALIILSLILVVTDTLYTILSIMIFTMPVILTIVIIVAYKNDPSMEYRVYKFKGDKENRYQYRNCCSMYFGLCTRDGAYYELVE